MVETYLAPTQRSELRIEEVMRLVGVEILLARDIVNALGVPDLQVCRWVGTCKFFVAWL